MCRIFLLPPAVMMGQGPESCPKKPIMVIDLMKCYSSWDP